VEDGAESRGLRIVKRDREKDGKSKSKGWNGMVKG
jgi:hypothetical protein